MCLKLSVIMVFFLTLLSTARINAFSLNADFMKPVTFNADFDKSCGYIFCDRISHELQNIYRLGVSCLKEKNISSCFREEARVDLWFIPARKNEVTLFSAIKITKNIDGPFIFCGILDF